MDAPYVEVRWQDAFGDSVDEATVENVGDKHKPMIMRTRGWAVKEDEKGISLFHEWSEDNKSYRGRDFIPRGMILSVEPYPPERKKRPKKVPRNTPSPTEVGSL